MTEATVAAAARTALSTSAAPSASTSACASADTAVAQARAFLLLLARQFPALLDELGATGTPRVPATRRTPSAGDAEAVREDRAAADANRRLGLTGLARTKAPIRLHVSDALRDITDGVKELDEAVHDRLRVRRAPRASVVETILRVIELLPRTVADDLLARHVRDEARRMARRASRTLGDDGPVLRLPGTCPHCDSVSLRHLPLDGAVWCINPDCRCAEDGCPCGQKNTPAHTWPDTGPVGPPSTTTDAGGTR